jgi:hypothetical protein
LRQCRATCQAYRSIELEIASQNDILENDDVVISLGLISAARIQPKNILIVETVVEEGEDDEVDDEEEPNIMDSMKICDVAAIRRGDLHSEITQENLAKRWHIGLDAANRTIKVTTQLGVRSLVHLAQRCFRTDLKGLSTLLSSPSCSRGHCGRMCPISPHLWQVALRIHKSSLTFSDVRLIILVFCTKATEEEESVGTNLGW